MNSGIALGLSVVLLILNAYFVGAEFAIMSARRSRIEPLAEGRSQTARRAKTVLWGMEHVTLLLAACQLGVTVCSTGLGAVAEPALAHLIAPPLARIGVPAAGAHTIAFFGALLIVVFLHVVLGEMVPKNISVTTPERAALWLTPTLVRFTKLSHLVIHGLNALANGVVRLTGHEPKDEVTSAFTADEVASIIERSEAEGVLQDDLGLLSGVIEFSERSAGEVMVPLSELVSLGAQVTPAEVERLVGKTGFSRFPVMDGAGIPVGYLHLKDVLYASAAQRHDHVPSWRVRDLPTIAADEEVEDALAVMQETGTHLVCVTADGAGPDAEHAPLGVVFLEDVLEELVGEVRDSIQRMAPRQSRRRTP